MRYEWDDAKNDANIVKHGFDFADAPRIFDLPLLAALDEREDYGETRYIGIGLLDGRMVVVVYAEPNSETTRIISLRKAQKHEQKRYADFLKNGLGAD